MKRTEFIRIRLSIEELEFLKQQQEIQQAYKFRTGRSNFSGFLRELLLDRCNYHRDSLTRQNDQLRYELRKIGTNINQIARKANAGFAVPEDMEKLLGYMHTLNTQFEKYIKVVEEAWESQS